MGEGLGGRTAHAAGTSGTPRPGPGLCHRHESHQPHKSITRSWPEALCLAEAPVKNAWHAECCRWVARVNQRGLDAWPSDPQVRRFGAQYVGREGPYLVEGTPPDDLMAACRPLPDEASEFVANEHHLLFRRHMLPCPEIHPVLLLHLQETLTGSGRGRGDSRSRCIPTFKIAHWATWPMTSWPADSSHPSRGWYTRRSDGVRVPCCWPCMSTGLSATGGWSGMMPRAGTTQAPFPPGKGSLIPQQDPKVRRLLVDLSVRGGLISVFRPVATTFVLLSPRSLMAQYMTDRLDQPDLPIALAHAVMATEMLPHESWVFVRWAFEDGWTTTWSPRTVMNWLVFALLCHRSTHRYQIQDLLRRHLPGQDWCTANQHSQVPVGSWAPGR